MEKIKRFIRKKQQKSLFFAAPSEALLGYRPLFYLSYRLRYFLIITLVGLATHIIEFSLLYYYLKNYKFVAIISFKVIFTLLNGAWWGTLEVMRERIRRYYQAKKIHEIGIEITLWLFFGLLVNVIILMATLPLSLKAFQDLIAGQFTLFDTYILIIIFQTITTLFVRTLHSGCFAIKRIYRPLASIIIYEICNVSFILLLLPFLGAFSLPVGVLLSTILNVIISTYYNLNMYRFVKIKPFALPKISHFIERVKQLFSKELITSSLSSLLMQVESVILLALLFHSMHFDHLTHASILLYFISPLIRASFDWVKLFYFDLKKYSNPLYANMVKIINHSIQRVGYLIALVFWIISLLLSISFNLYDLPILIVLLPLFFVRSILAHWQMHRFTESRYLDILYSGLIASIGIIVPAFLQWGIYSFLTSVILFMALAILCLKYIRTQAIEGDRYHPPETPFYEWALSLQSKKILKLEFSETKSAQRSKNFIAFIHSQFPTIKLTRESEFEVLLDTAQLLNQQELVKQAAGTVYSVKTVDLSNYRKSENTHTLRPISKAVKIDLKNPDPALFSFYENEELTEIFYALQHFLKWPLKYLANSSYHVCAQLEEKKVRWIYITQKTIYTKKQLTHWQAQVHKKNLADLLLQF